MRKVIVATVVFFVVCMLSSCGPMLAGDNGYVTCEGDAKGMAAFLDGMNGMITNGKASPDQGTAHWTTRQAQGKDVTPASSKRRF